MTATCIFSGQGQVTTRRRQARISSQSSGPTSRGNPHNGGHGTAAMLDIFTPYGVTQRY
jgi:hypothetical protein